MKKYLIIRFSSIGDVVLTSPIIRCLKLQVPNVELHFATKKAFGGIIEANPHIDKVFTIEKEIDEIVPDLIAENYDFLIDLHHNLRTYRLKRQLKVASAAFPKLNFEKFLLTQFKINRMPVIHVVDRYFEAVKTLGVVNDRKGLDYFIPTNDQIDLATFGIDQPFIAMAIGAQFSTKRLTKDQLTALVEKIDLQVVLLGGLTDNEVGETIQAACPAVINLCGKLNLNQSASVVSQAKKVVTHDTGLMHIASAFKLPIISIWGNTVPAFGMYPYLPENQNLVKINEVKISCRPCSKIGYNQCPKKHFNCMKMHDLSAIATQINAVN